MNKEPFFSRFKIRTFLLLIVVYLAIIFGWTWVWGVLFFIWVIPNLISGTTHVVEPIDRREHPIWYWLIVGSWLWMSAYIIIAHFFGWSY